MKIKILPIIFILALLMLISVLRVKEKISYINLINNLLGEFLYTGISYITGLVSNEIVWFKIPTEFLKYIINLTPKVIYNDYYYISPLGARNIYVSIISNFGEIGALIYIYIFSKIVIYFQKQQNEVMKALYYYVLGVIPFMLFRDPLEMVIVKVIFKYGIFLLFLEYFIGAFLKQILNMEKMEK